MSSITKLPPARPTRTFPSRTSKPVTFRLTETKKTAIIVSLIWLIIGVTIVAFLVNSQAQYNRGVFDGMTKTKSILK